MHADQLTVIIRYVLQSGPVERFLTFIPIFSHTGLEIAQIILQFLEENGINIENCRGQSYDNAANISGIYNGVQAIIRERYSVTYYVLCTAHSLNFVASTDRWQVYRKHLRELPGTMALSDTRWSARHDAINSVNKGYNENMSALEELLTNEHLPRDSRHEAEGFLKKLQQLEVVILLELWNPLLGRLSENQFCKKVNCLCIQKFIW